MSQCVSRSFADRSQGSHRRGNTNVWKNSKTANFTTQVSGGYTTCVSGSNTKVKGLLALEIEEDYDDDEAEEEDDDVV